MNQEANPIHLSDLIGRVYAYHREKEAEFSEKVDREAARLAQREENISKAQKKALSQVQKGEKSVTELRGIDEDAYHTLRLHVDAAKEALLESELERDGKDFFKNNVWDHVKQAIYKVVTDVTDMFGGEWLEDYACRVSLNALTGSDNASKEIACLHEKDYTVLLLQEIWEKYPQEAMAMGLPQPPNPGSKELPPLTDNEQDVLDLIKSLPAGKGITGKKIIAKLSKQGIRIDQSTLTKHVIPRLKEWYGVKNRRGVGYYCESK